jgi:hypothetical protein
MAVAAVAVALAVTGAEAWDAFALVSIFGLIASAAFALRAEAAARRGQIERGPVALFLAYCLLLTVPAFALYGRVDAWQDLGSVGRAIGADAAGRPLVLMTPDETTRAMIDMYARTQVDLIRAPADATSVRQLNQALAREPRALVVVQLPGRQSSEDLRRIAARFGFKVRAASDQVPDWASASGLRLAKRYALPNGRRYALLESAR